MACCCDIQDCLKMYLEPLFLKDNYKCGCFWFFYSKIKLYFWPPVPNLEKVLQDYLTEINGKRWVNSHYMTHKKINCMSVIRPSRFIYVTYIYLCYLYLSVKVQNACIKIRFFMIHSWCLHVSMRVTSALKEFLFAWQDPPLTAKQCTEDTIPSMVEVLTDDEVLGLEKPPPEATVPILSPAESCSSREGVDGSCGTEVFPNYVTLSKDFLSQFLKENTYVCECETCILEDGGQTVKDESCQTHLSSCTDSTPPSSDFLNHSYLPLAEPADRFDWKNAAGKVSGNLYSNLPCS